MFGLETDFKYAYRFSNDDKPINVRKAIQFNNR